LIYKLLQLVNVSKSNKKDPYLLKVDEQSLLLIFFIRSIYVLLFLSV